MESSFMTIVDWISDSAEDEKWTESTNIEAVAENFPSAPIIGQSVKEAIALYAKEREALAENFRRVLHITDFAKNLNTFRKDSVSTATKDLLGLQFDALRQDTKKSLLDVQRYLSLGWVGLWEILYEKNLDMSNLMNLWQDFFSFLLRPHDIILKLEKIFTFWEKVLYLLLFLAFSEFPNSLRPPCTTTPWTFWPALVILWGVCWIFCEPLDSDWEAGVFEDVNSGAQFPSLDLSHFEFKCNAPEWNAPHSDSFYLEQRMQQSTPGTATDFHISTPTGFVLASLPTKPQDTLNLPFSTDGVPSATAVATSVAPCQATSAAQEPAEERSLEAAEFRTLATFDTSSFVYEQPLDGTRSATTEDRQTKPSLNSRHGHTERYHCSYPDCNRSRQGSGFYRKDHLDRHLRGKHEQSSVARIRAKPAARSSSHDPTTATSQVAQAASQSKKRKHREDGESDAHRVDELADGHVEELAEERRLRLPAEQENQQLQQENQQLQQENQQLQQENQRLRQKLEKYEERIERYEERIDRMMTLVEKKQG